MSMPDSTGQPRTLGVRARLADAATGLVIDLGAAAASVLYGIGGRLADGIDFLADGFALPAEVAERAQLTRALARL